MAFASGDDTISLINADRCEIYKRSVEQLTSTTGTAVERVGLG